MKTQAQINKRIDMLIKSLRVLEENDDGSEFNKDLMYTTNQQIKELIWVLT